MIVEGGKILVSRAIREDSNQTKLIWAKKEKTKCLKLVSKLDFFCGMLIRSRAPGAHALGV